MTESCEDGNLFDGDGCSSSCIIETGWTCSSVVGPPEFSTCTPICGDGLNVFGEICDDGVLEGIGC